MLHQSDVCMSKNKHCSLFNSTFAKTWSLPILGIQLRVCKKKVNNDDKNSLVMHIAHMMWENPKQKSNSKLQLGISAYIASSTKNHKLVTKWQRSSSLPSAADMGRLIYGSKLIE